MSKYLDAKTILSGVIAAIILATLTFIWNWAQTGGPAHLFGGLTEKEVVEKIQRSQLDATTAQLAFAAKLAQVQSEIDVLQKKTAQLDVPTVSGELQIGIGDGHRGVLAITWDGQLKYLPTKQNALWTIDLNQTPGSEQPLKTGK